MEIYWKKKKPRRSGVSFDQFPDSGAVFQTRLATGIKSPPCWQIHVFGDLRIASTLINRWLESRYFSTPCYVALVVELIPSALRARVCSLSLRLDANFSRNSASNLRLISAFTSRHLLGKSLERSLKLPSPRQPRPRRGPFGSGGVENSGFPKFLPRHPLRTDASREARLRQ